MKKLEGKGWGVRERSGGGHGCYPFKNVVNILSKGNQVIMVIILVTVL